MDLATIGTVLGSLFTITASYFVAKYKSKNSSFNSIIKANETFREEVRKDLLQAKKDLEVAAKTIFSMRSEIDQLRKDLSIASKEIEDLRNALGYASLERETLRGKLGEFTQKAEEDKKEIARLTIALQECLNS